MAVEHRVVVAVAMAAILGRWRLAAGALAGVSPPASGARRGRQWLVPVVVGLLEVDDGDGDAGRRRRRSAVVSGLLEEPRLPLRLLLLPLLPRPGAVAGCIDYKKILTYN
jgi:hypothetical protein